ncbi:MAG: hypothetical protein U0N82_02460 [Oscillospiraceae bacterium]
MKEFDRKNIKGLSMEDLETVSGGRCEDYVPEYLDMACPMCGVRVMNGYYNEYIDGKPVDVMVCNFCYEAFYYNEAGELVHYGQILG